MNKEELIYCLDRARNGVVKVNNDEEGDFVVKKLKEFGSVCLVSKLPSEIKPQYPTHIGIGDNDWWTYSYPSGNLNVIEFEEFKKIVESEDKTSVQITVNTKEELITQLQNGNVGIRLEGEEEGEYLINWMKKNDVIYINDDNTSGSIIEHGDIIGVTECCGKYVWDFEDEVKLVITFKRFKEIIELKEYENNTKNDVCVISDNTWTMETVESKIKESTKVDPPINKTNDPFDLLRPRRTPLSAYSIEELENELERRRNQKLKALENTISTAFEELIKMGYKIHNAYSDDNMDGGINVSIEKKEVLIS